MPTVYLETSIICHLTDPPSPNPITRACQQLTQLWWHTRCNLEQTCISKYVNDEIRDGDPLRAIHRMRVTQDLVQHPKKERIESMGELLIFGGGLNANARRAAEHIACATFNHCEILLTWNCAEIANALKLKLLRMLVDDGEYVLPELITPFELMECSYETEWRRNS
ncbi:DNA-binding protein [Pseudoduganella sp. FT55W]|uniref:DNA-binding protein n=1 Tax=Duganella rivi TaxID=2666083 RepID=A0A7X4GUZ6_9BURK|nr:type II toxin-antitoxin system VapC family toxin [Duganella rivi]MYM70136.1 DNA-binding protein [Duganella rivi]